MDTVAQAANQMMGTPYNSIGKVEITAVLGAMNGPLSGYLAGKERGGRWVLALEDAWCEIFGVKHAIACNSNTSGMMAAAFAVGLGPNNTFACPAMTMSATAAAPMFTGAQPIFGDVEDETFGLKPDLALLSARQKAAFVTNLFGHPAHLAWWRKSADTHGFYLIEDNAQAPFAMEAGRYAGTIGHIGVFSLNVHKHFQCGEGGVIVTESDDLARRMRAFINHGEHAGNEIGLNLRMPEVCAAIALAQVRRGRELVAWRMEQAAEIIYAIGDIPGIRPPIIREGCTHSFYCIPFLIDKGRASFLNILHDQGVPIIEGYVDPLYRMPAFERNKRGALHPPCPIAEDLHDRRLFYIENCAYTFTKSEITKIGDAFRRAADAHASCRV